MPIKYSFGTSFQKKLLLGIEKLNKVVSISLGPKGQLVLISPKGRRPVATKDGYTITKLFQLDDIYENLGVNIAKEVSERNATLCGDGSTTVLVLLNAILQYAQKYLIAGATPTNIQNGIKKISEYFLKYLVNNSQKIKSRDDIFNVAMISANNDKVIGEMISNAIDAIGKDGAILIEDSKSFETILKLVEGFSFNSGYSSSEFINNERKQSVCFNEPFYLITDHKIDTVQEMLPLLEIIARDGRPLIIIADEVSGQAHAALIRNAINGILKIAVVKSPFYGQEKRNMMLDIALTTGATFVTRESGMRLKDIKLEHLGSSKSIESLKTITTIVDGKGKQEKIKEKIDALKEEIKQTSDLNECKKIQERVTRLSSGIAIIYVGGNTEIEAIEKRHRIEDAVEASRSAIEAGISEGGGIALMKLALSEETEKYIQENSLNEDEKFGMKILQKAIQEPFRKIISNANLNSDLILSQCNLKDGIGYDVANDKFVNMLESGIIDPTKVICFALKHSVSVALQLIATSAAIIET